MPGKVESYLIEQIRPEPKVNTKKTFAHISVIVNRGKILAIGTNQSGSRSQGCGYSRFTLHAEISALKNLGDYEKLRGASLYVWRFNKSCDAIMNSKPCHECTCVLEKCMKKYGLKNVYYTS